MPTGKNQPKQGFQQEELSAQQSGGIDSETDEESSDGNQNNYYGREINQNAGQYTFRRICGLTISKLSTIYHDKAFNACKATIVQLF